MAEVNNRNYPTGDYVSWYANKAGISTDEVVRGVHIGNEEPNGVGSPSDFEGMLPFHIVYNPADGWNDGAKYVTYFKRAEDGTIWKACNADLATLTQLTSGDEYEAHAPKASAV